MFVECFRYFSAKSTFIWKGDCAPSYQKNSPIERIYRCHEYVASLSEPGSTSPTSLCRPSADQFDFMVVNLYGYMPGELWYDNVSVRPMTEKEMANYQSTTPKPADKRFDR